MNRTYRVLTLAVLTSAFVIPAAQASDGTVNFNGLLVARTCNVSVNGGSNVGTVVLPTLSTAALASAGATAGRTMFTIGLSGCNTSIQDFLDSLSNPGTPAGFNLSASAYFEGGAGVDPVSHNVINAGGNATGVQLQLINFGGGVIKAGDSQQPALLGVRLTVGGGVMRYGVQYVATEATTAGSVVGSVTYSIAYN